MVVAWTKPCREQSRDYDVISISSAVALLRLFLALISDNLSHGQPGSTVLPDSWNSLSMRLFKFYLHPIVSIMLHWLSAFTTPLLEPMPLTSISTKPRSQDPSHLCSFLLCFHYMPPSLAVLWHFHSLDCYLAETWRRFHT
jgi:hypothetical protein